MLLPPIGTPLDDELTGEICSAIIRKKEECRLVMDPFIEWADLSRNYFHYCAPEPPEDGLIVVSDIQNDCITQTDIQTKEPPNITLEPVDTEQPPKFFHNLPPQVCQQLGLDPSEYQVTADPTDPTGSTMCPTQPLGPQSVMLIQGAIQAGKLPPNALISIGISELADFYQKIFDVIWQRSNPDKWWWQNSLWNNVDGWVPVLFEFDFENVKARLKNMPIRQVFIDPTVEDIEDASSVIVDIVYDAEVAKRLMPKFADQIEEYATPQGKIVRPPGTLQMGSQYEDVSNFQTPTITLTVWFLRDQPMFLDPQDAIAGGMMESRKVGTGNWKHVTAPQNPAQLNIEEEQRDGLFVTGGWDGSKGEEGGDEGGGGGEVFPPGDPNFDPDNWPTKRVTRQITAIATHAIVLDDCESLYYDGIPLALNINIPILGKPCGIGEPFRRRGHQDGRSRLLNNLMDSTDYFAHPIAEAPMSARDQLPEEYRDGHTHPGMIFWINDDLAAKNPNGVFKYREPPQPNAMLMTLNQELKQEGNDSGGNMAAINGKAPDQQAQMSGIAISLVQTGAASMASYKGKRTQTVIKRISHLLLHAILTLPPETLYKIIKKYPLNVVADIAAMGPELEWTIKVAIAAGAGQLLAQKKAEAKDNFAKGLQSKETTQQACGIDPQQEGQRMGEEQQQAQQAQLPQQQRIQSQQPPAQPAAAVASGGGQGG